MKTFLFEAKAVVKVRAETEEEARLIACGLKEPGHPLQRSMAIHESNLTLVKLLEEKTEYSWLGAPRVSEAMGEEPTAVEDGAGNDD